jgi:glutamate synthase (NADPH/NADH) large chain
MSLVTLEPVLTSAEQEANVDRSIWHSQLRGDQSETDETILKRLIERHFKYTGSALARNLLDDWSNGCKNFIKVFPNEYKRALSEINTERVPSS